MRLDLKIIIMPCQLHIPFMRERELIQRRSKTSADFDDVFWSPKKFIKWNSRLVVGVRICCWNTYKLIQLKNTRIVFCNQNCMVVITNLWSRFRIWLMRFRKIAFNAVQILNSFGIAIHLFLYPLIDVAMLCKSKGFLSKLNSLIDIQLVISTAIQQR